jgi:uncharacterized protein with ParB-like and HNH nuclease domain
MTQKLLLLDELQALISSGEVIRKQLIDELIDVTREVNYIEEARKIPRPPETTWDYDLIVDARNRQTALRRRLDSVTAFQELLNQQTKVLCKRCQGGGKMKVWEGEDIFTLHECVDCDGTGAHPKP